MQRKLLLRAFKFAAVCLLCEEVLEWLQWREEEEEEAGGGGGEEEEREEKEGEEETLLEPQSFCG